MSPTSGQVAISLDKVSKEFGGAFAVRDLTFSVSKGEIYALIGPNGAGKTTTVKMLAGIMAPSSGKIQILKHNLLQNPVQAKAKLGYIPDDPFVYEYLSGREFLQLTANLYNLAPHKLQIKIKKLLSLYNLEEVINGLFSEYSRGNKQKTVILANLLHDPEVLIIDEPIVGLDVQSQRVTEKIFRNFVDQGGSILLCTHTLNVAQKLADKIGILHQGRLIEEGSFKDLREKAHQKQADLEELYLKLTGRKP